MGISLLDAQQVSSNVGLRTAYGLILPPGARVAAYVRSTGVQTGDDAFIATNLVSTLAQGLARCRAGFGDFVVCLPGHVETVGDGTTFSAALVAGTRILGVGRGANAPTFNFTTIQSSWSVAVNDVLITGLRLIVGSTAFNVTNAINVTGNDFGFYGNYCDSSSSGVPIALLTMAGTAARYEIIGNIITCNGSAVSNTIVITSTGANGRIEDNEIVSGAFTGTGLILVSSACAGLKILRNILNNTTAASVACINLANVGISGQCAYNTITVLNTGAVVSGTTGITIGAAVTMGFFQNFVVNDVLKSGLLLPTADT